jgi:two-component sensor histidine kinase
MQRLSILICVFWFPLLLLAQDEVPDSELYNLAASETLADLPLDTVFAKVPSVFDKMRGEIDAQVKEDFQEIVARSEQTKEPKYIAKAHRLLAMWHYLAIDSETPDSIYLYDSRALKAWLQTTDTAAIAKSYADVGIDLYDMQQYEEAEKYCMQGLKFAKAIQDEDRITSIHSYLAIIYTATQDYESALQYTEEVIATYEAQERTHPLIRALANLSNIQVQMGNAQEGVASAERALVLIDQLPEDRRESETYNIRAWRGRAYKAVEKYDEALDDLLFAWQGMGSLYGEAAVDGWKGDIGDIYRLKGDCETAISYLRDYYYHTVARKVQTPKEFLDYTNNLATCFQLTNQLDSALVYFQKAKDTKVNLLEEELAALKNELRIKYDTEQKEETIADQSIQIQQQRQIQQLSFGIGGLLILLLGGLFLTYRNNRRKNDQLQLLNENLEDTNAQLDQRNAQNELLLKEIHHRVKNNLETVSSLLELQSAQVDDVEVQSVMQASQSRVQSMSILHQKLYQGKNLAGIDMPDYFKNLVESILDTYDAWDKVAIEYDVAAIELDIDTAVPIGLIANELITNSLKYAFPDQEQGKIEVSLQQEGQQMLFSVKDNGIGIQKNTTPSGTGFGSQLIRLLVMQLNGKMMTEHEEGLRTIIAFKK